jgi:hypothetical protein
MADGRANMFSAVDPLLQSRANQPTGDLKWLLAIKEIKVATRANPNEASLPWIPSASVKSPAKGAVLPMRAAMRMSSLRKRLAGQARRAMAAKVATKAIKVAKLKAAAVMKATKTARAAVPVVAPANSQPMLAAKATRTTTAD